MTYGPMKLEIEVKRYGVSRTNWIEQSGSRKFIHSLHIWTIDFILRLSNPDAEGLHHATRVQNEVGILNHASEALTYIKPAVVTRVFGWDINTGSENPGWILQERMPGEPLANFNGMSLAQKRGILAQIAELLKGLQEFRLPESIKGWGGVTYDDRGVLVSAPMIVVGAGPWSSLQEAFGGRVKEALSKTDKSPQLRGWSNNGVGERINRFVEHGVSALIAHLESKNDRSIIHGDFTTDNLLYDPKTGRITALLDCDFACIQHPAHEFFCSFATWDGQLGGWSPDPEAASLRHARLTGRFPSPLPARHGSDIDWEIAEAWEIELQKLGAKRPSLFQGIDRVAEIEALLGLLLPWRLTNEDALRRNPDEEKRKGLRQDGERQLQEILEHLGF
ncbi:kinase-like domain-containing protein [Cadophora sp. MPI-SDFR-AT-0126]|nr:kinase-like domain-containing protein [Leotiomycetes sp. MPI-SDFR-AT-0126]